MSDSEQTIIEHEDGTVTATAEKTVTLKIEKVADERGMNVNVEIPGIGTALFRVHAAGPTVARGERGGVDFVESPEPWIESYGLTPAAEIEL